MEERVDPQVFIAQDTAQRATASQQALMRHLDAIERSDYTEHNAMLELTQAHAKLVDAVVSHTDTMKPVISTPSPAPSSNIRVRKPIIGTYVRDGQITLAKANLQLFVDGVRVRTFTYNEATERLTYTPATSLVPGKHTVKVTAQDAASNSISKQWSFNVVG
jgi:hypothetical protein